jgi:TonB family protein
MTVPESNPQKGFLSRFLAVSAALHLFCYLILMFGPLLPTGTPKPYLPSLRVDLVGLPAQKTNETAAPPPDAATAPTPATAPAIKKSKPRDLPEEGDYSLKKSKNRAKESKKEKEAKRKLKQAIERIRAIERIKSLTASEEVRGNRISKGTSLSAEARTTLEAGYFEVVLEQVRTHWELPKWLLGQGLSAKVLLQIDSRGNIRNFKFVQSSGNPAFDLEVKRALLAANPFPIPPGDISGGVLNEGILLGFPL